MELRHIRYFLAVAEEGNFTRAAARLGLGQPPLSMQIRALEEEVGARLFHRVPQGAELTDAGRAFFEVVRGLPGRAEQAIQAARRASRGETGVLALGFTSSSVLHPAVPAAIRGFRRAYPDVDLRLDEANSMALEARLADGRLDLAILRPGPTSADAMMLHPWLDEPLVAALPAGHAAAREAGAIDLKLIRDRPLILTPRAVGVSLHDAAVEACRRAGFEPMLGQPGPQIASILALVAADLGVTLVPESAGQLALEGVVYRPLQQLRLVHLALAHRRGEASVPVHNFVRLARQGSASIAERR